MVDLQINTGGEIPPEVVAIIEPTVTYVATEMNYSGSLPQINVVKGDIILPDGSLPPSVYDDKKDIVWLSMNGAEREKILIFKAIVGLDEIICKMLGHEITHAIQNRRDPKELEKLRLSKYHERYEEEIHYHPFELEAENYGNKAVKFLYGREVV